MALASLSVAILSMADHGLKRTKRLKPLPLAAGYADVQRAELPPFLPDVLPLIEEEFDPLLTTGMEMEMEEIDLDNVKRSGKNDNGGGGGNNDGNIMSEGNTIPADPLKSASDSKSNKGVEIIQAGWERMTHIKTPQSFSSMLAMRKRIKRLKEREYEQLKRNKIRNELLMLQDLKRRQSSLEKSTTKVATNRLKKSAGGWNFNNVPKVEGRNIESVVNASPPLGYALITGASKGIGRAIAVECARWGIPLILVARDLGRLNTLADDIEACYGVQCRVLQADLSELGTAKRIHRATSDAGLHVDLLVNNAGMCSWGTMVDMTENDIEDMIHLNIGSVTALSRLYGRDMKNQKRGRIMFVSSLTGAVPGGPGVAAYAATKAYEKSLSLSMGRELERHGVGVTCLMPGAVKGTSFATASKREDAFCWKIPFYCMRAPRVASIGVRALLSGDPEVVPGWHNRAFLKIFIPMLPQRMTTSIVQLVLNPLRIMPIVPWRKERYVYDTEVTSPTLELKSKSDSSPDITLSKFTPRVLNLPMLENNIAQNTTIIDGGRLSLKDGEMIIDDTRMSDDITIPSQTLSNETIVVSHTNEVIKPTDPEHDVTSAINQYLDNNLK